MGCGLYREHKGGLGLRRIATLNRALLGKWIWRFACEKNNFWNQVITTKYGQEDYGWRPKKLGRVPKSNFGKIDGALTFRCPNASINSLSLNVHRDATIEEMWDRIRAKGIGSLFFVRDFNDWEMDMVGRGCLIL
ncbi:hypothetical protein CK203_083237 [Vitis vinifera]|uniref:Uncharacterized protein n=1 Tax=Vitis vinifera TaxID=29760 RepID=A0A438D3Y0_VITVI|nr:hypothetical protein CK203_083237 [Vitis vinifera]